MFCEKCTQLVCHLCVCEGDGEHVGHTVLAPETAHSKIAVSFIWFSAFMCACMCACVYVLVCWSAREMENVLLDLSKIFFYKSKV